MSEKQRLYGKGSGSSGCLLNSTLKDEKQFVVWPLSFEVRDISLSGSFVVCLDMMENLYFWGTLNHTVIQKPVLLHTQVNSMSSGWNHFLFTNQQGLWGMGSNAYLELGVHTQKQYISQPLFLSQQKVQNFAAGFRQSYFITQRHLWGCGESRKHELGLSEKNPRKWAILWQRDNTMSSKIVEMHCGKRYLLMLGQDGSVWAFGNNEQNAFNNAQLSHSIIPTVVFRGIKQVASGWAHCVLLDEKQNILSFGRNNLGQLGRKQAEVVKLELQQAQKVKRIVSGTQFCFAVSDQGRVFGWGWNQHWNIANCGQNVLVAPQLLELPGKCVRIWTHAATTVIECRS